MIYKNIIGLIGIYFIGMFYGAHMPKYFCLKIAPAIGSGCAVIIAFILWREDCKKQGEKEMDKNIGTFIKKCKRRKIKNKY